jgi:nitrogenase molybdenum-iron protein beta chain
VAIPQERPGTGCALHGALHSATAIPGVVPILHATPGCGVQSYHGGLAAGWATPGPAGGLAVPATNLSEKHIVFGGGSRLREQIKNTLKMIDGRLYVVLTSCAIEMIGDDVPALTKEARDQGHPILEISTAGFHGSAPEGYELFLRGILARHDVLGPVGLEDRTLVTILGLVPGQDVFWQAELEEWTRLLTGIGLRANPVFGLAGGVDGLRDLARAGLTLVLSPWGAGVAQELETRFGVPWVDAGGLPVGAAASADVLRTVASRLRQVADAGEAFIAAEAKREDHFLQRLADAYFRLGLQREFALVAGSSQVVGLARFLAGTLGWLPRVIVVTDAPPEAARGAIAAELAGLAEGARILFTGDATEIADAVADSGAEIVLGRAFDRAAAARLGVPLVEVAYPVLGRLALDKGLSGNRGALTLIEEISRAILATEPR